MTYLRERFGRLARKFSPSEEKYVPATNKQDINPRLTEEQIAAYMKKMKTAFNKMNETTTRQNLHRLNRPTFRNFKTFQTYSKDDSFIKYLISIEHIQEYKSYNITSMLEKLKKIKNAVFTNTTLSNSDLDPNTVRKLGYIKNDVFLNTKKISKDDLTYMDSNIKFLMELYSQYYKKTKKGNVETSTVNEKSLNSSYQPTKQVSETQPRPRLNTPPQYKNRKKGVSSQPVSESSVTLRPREDKYSKPREDSTPPPSQSIKKASSSSSQSPSEKPNHINLSGVTLEEEQAGGSKSKKSQKNKTRKTRKHHRK